MVSVDHLDLGHRPSPSDHILMMELQLLVLEHNACTVYTAGDVDKIYDMRLISFHLHLQVVGLNRY